jgi:hypothetical protein
MLSDAKARRTRQCEAPYAATIQHCEQTCHPTAKRVSDKINGAAQVELVKERVIMHHIVQHRIYSGVVVRSTEAGVYRYDEPSEPRQRKKILKAAGRAGSMEIDNWLPPPRLEDFDANSIDHDSALGKSRHLRSSLFGCDLERRRCEFPDAGNHLFGE